MMHRNIHYFAIMAMFALGDTFAFRPRFRVKGLGQGKVILPLVIMHLEKMAVLSLVLNRNTTM